MKTIETKRLQLRPFQLTDAEDVYAYATHDEVGPNAGWKPHESITESTYVIEHIFIPTNVWAVVLKDTNKVIGSIGLHDCPEEGENFSGLNLAELGYVLGFHYWNQGLMTEATSEIIRHAFEELNYDVLFCYHFAHNLRSKKVILKNHFTYYKTIQKDFPQIQQTYDCVGYILKNPYNSKETEK